MDAAAERGDWNAAGMNAVHVVISAADALTTFYLGERSTGDSHLDVLALLGRIPRADASDHTKQAAGVLRAKNEVEYEDVDFDERSAARLQKQAARFLEWAREQLPK